MKTLKLLKDLYFNRFIKPRLKEVKSQLRKADLYYHIPRQFHFLKALQAVKGIDGAIAEAGVRNGDSLLFLSGASRSLGKKRKALAFDSFEGFPDNYYQQLGRAKPKPELSQSEAIDQIANIFKNANFEETDYELIPGYFKDSLKTYNPGPIALLHIDVDIPESYTEALQYLYPHVVQGGIVLFDEYFPEFTKYKEAKSSIDNYLVNQSYERLDTGFDQKLAIRKL